ncbi:hexose transporter [Ilyonectria robusta]
MHHLLHFRPFIVPLELLQSHGPISAAFLALSGGTFDENLFRCSPSLPKTTKLWRPHGIAGVRRRDAEAALPTVPHDQWRRRMHSNSHEVQMLNLSRHSWKTSHLSNLVSQAFNQINSRLLNMGFNTVYFDKYNPSSEKSTNARQELAHLDYSPLKRVSGRSWAMGILISMGGMV